MAATTFLDTPQGRRLAYHKSEGAGPTVVFLGGLRSDMEGTKAVHLEDWARARGQAYLRFDYSGHGESSGRFEEGCIGDWHEDTVAAVSANVGCKDNAQERATLHGNYARFSAWSTLFRMVLSCCLKRAKSKV